MLVSAGQRRKRGTVEHGATPRARCVTIGSNKVSDGAEVRQKARELLQRAYDGIVNYGHWTRTGRLS